MGGQFDWVGLIGAFVLAQILVWSLQPILVLALSWSAFFVWRHWRNQRATRLADWSALLPLADELRPQHQPLDAFVLAVDLLRIAGQADRLD